MFYISTRTCQTANPHCMLRSMQPRQVAEKPADRTSDCCRLTRYAILDERIIANALADADYSSKVGQYPGIWSASRSSRRKISGFLAALLRRIFPVRRARLLGRRPMSRAPHFGVHLDP